MSRQTRRQLFARLAVLAPAALLVSLAGCASRPPPPAPEASSPAPAVWRGRLSLLVEDAPSQSVAGDFELRGSASAGEFWLFSPLGTTLARLAWNPGGATLSAQGQERSAASLPALTLALTGTEFPIQALFDWLAGSAASAAGWVADLSGVPEGKLRARRATPAPAAELRVILERP